MDPKEFQSRESDKLVNWVSSTLALKEAKINTTDAMVSVGQRVQVDIQTETLEDVATPPMPISESKASSIPNGDDVDLSKYYTKDEVDELLEKYYTKEEIDTKFEEYYTKEEIDTKFEEYYTKEEIDNLLDKYATKEWVTSELSNLEDSIKGWTETNFVNHNEFEREWWNVWDNDGGFIDEFVSETALEEAEGVVRNLGVDATCADGQVTVTLTGLP